MNPDLVWTAALGELQLQMDSATFDTWLRRARFAGYEDGVFVVALESKAAKDWIERRHYSTVQRTLRRLTKQDAVDIRFVVGEGSSASTPFEAKGDQMPPPQPFVLPDYDVHEAGWYKMAGYESRFWAPALGRVAWRVIEIVREEDKRKSKTEWTPGRRYSAPALAEQVPCGRQAILGVNRTCESGTDGAVEAEDGVWQLHLPGAFDRLQGLGLAQIERRGLGRHTTYWVSVRNQLGLLWPALVVDLPSRLQVQHDQWLADHGFAPREWDIGSR
jgi:hypothetical protein